MAVLASRVGAVAGVTARTQKCAECGREQAAGERGWRAYLTDDDEVAVFCPECSSREFGDRAPVMRQ